MNCVFKNPRMQNKCGLLHDTVPCMGTACSWYTTGEMKLRSLVKAARIYLRNHPNGDIREVVPDIWVEKVENVLLGETVLDNQ